MIFRYKATDKLTSKPVEIIGLDFENNDAVIRIQGMISIKPFTALNFHPSTSLKDKNGNVIYVGDRLQFTHHAGYILQSQILQVIWIEDHAGFGYISELNKDYLHSFSMHDELQEDILNYCEVIGNTID